MPSLESLAGILKSLSFAPKDTRDPMDIPGTSITFDGPTAKIETITPRQSRARMPAGTIEEIPQTSNAQWVANVLSNLLTSAQPRPDLGQGKVATFAGRVVRPGENVQDVMNRFPQAELEQGSIAMQAPELLKAMIAPVVWKSMTPATKAVTTQMFNENPGVMQRVLRDPKSYEVRGDNLGRGTYGVYDPKTAVINLNKYLPEGFSVPTVLHETQHFLNPARVAKTNPEDAATIAMLLHDYLPASNRGSLDRNLAYLTSVGGTPMLSGSLRPEHVTPSRLMGKFDLYKSDNPLANEVARNWYGEGVASRFANLSRASMDEALAYTAENAKSNSLLQQLANALGLLGK